MNIKKLHDWSLTPKEAIQVQHSLKERLNFHCVKKTVNTVAGIDVSYSRKLDKVYAGIVVFSYPELDKTEETWFSGQSPFPYVPGLLSFREIPPLIEAFKKLKKTPDIIICDGQGIAHPRGFGLASHLGLLTDLPSIGCAKSRLVGETYEQLGPQKGNFVNLYYQGKKVGVVLRTKDNVKPLYISIGHNIDLTTSIETVLSCCTKYRLPETTRAAHNLVNRIRVEEP